jgi:hypothetical protein
MEERVSTNAASVSHSRISRARTHRNGEFHFRRKRYDRHRGGNCRSSPETGCWLSRIFRDNFRHELTPLTPLTDQTIYPPTRRSNARPRVPALIPGDTSASPSIPVVSPPPPPILPPLRRAFSQDSYIADRPYSDGAQYLDLSPPHPFPPQYLLHPLRSMPHHQLTNLRHHLLLHHLPLHPSRTPITG